MRAAVEIFGPAMKSLDCMRSRRLVGRVGARKASFSGELGFGLLRDGWRAEGALTGHDLERSSLRRVVGRYLGRSSDIQVILVEERRACCTTRTAVAELAEIVAAIHLQARPATFAGVLWSSAALDSSGRRDSAIRQKLLTTGIAQILTPRAENRFFFPLPCFCCGWTDVDALCNCLLNLLDVLCVGLCGNSSSSSCLTLGGAL